MNSMINLSYAQKLYYKNTAKLIFIPILLILIGIIALYFSGKILLSALYTVVLCAYILGLLTPLIFKRVSSFLDKIIDPIYDNFTELVERERDSALRGMEGEKIVFEWMKEILPSTHRLIPNFILPNSKSDIDAIVLGPNGLFVFEIKNISYKYFFTTEDYAIIAGEKIIPGAGEDPREQLGRNARRLEKFLISKNCGDIKIKQAIIFAKEDSMIFLGRPKIYLIDNKESLRRFILESVDDSSFTVERCETITQALRIQS